MLINNNNNNYNSKNNEMMISLLSFSFKSFQSFDFLSYEIFIHILAGTRGFAREHLYMIVVVTVELVVDVYKRQLLH